MKFLSVRDLRPIAILSAVTEDTLEETMAAIRRSRAVAAVSELQRQSVRKGITPAESDAEIASVRRARKKQGNPPQ